ncbi:hypothetical protein ACH5RR_006700 [Cinchona calisaya]|uniref:RNase H type-1 domain-containing protein n=1 Tax=Cinchona calisaya TaxID=153742 RepID=A0ABD3AQ61_9GENT
MCGWWKLNCDGAAKGNPERTLGRGIIRDYTSHGVAGISCYYRVGTNLEAEAKDLLDGINLSLQLNVNQVQVELDSNILIQIMNGIFSAP